MSRSVDSSQWLNTIAGMLPIVSAIGAAYLLLIIVKYNLQREAK